MYTLLLKAFCSSIKQYDYPRFTSSSHRSFETVKLALCLHTGTEVGDGNRKPTVLMELSLDFNHTCSAPGL